MVHTPGSCSQGKHEGGGQRQGTRQQIAEVPLGNDPDDERNVTEQQLQSHEEMLANQGREDMKQHAASVPARSANLRIDRC
jgi:hypothetical protein